MLRAPMNYPQLDPKACLLHNIKIADLAIKGIKLQSSTPANQKRLVSCRKRRESLCQRCRRAYAFDAIPIPPQVDAILKRAEQ